MHVLNGTIVAEKILNTVAQRARAFEKEHGRRPSVAVVLVGDDAPSHLYVKLKQKAAHSVGIDFHKYIFAANEAPEAVLQAVTFLAADPDVDAMLIQMPLPEGFDADALVQTMGSAKDVDGFHPASEERFLADASTMSPVFPRALLAMVEASGEDVQGKRAALIVNSERFGRVLAAACVAKGMVPQVILADKVPCMHAAILSADVVITACGTPGLITSRYLKSGAVVIDGGISARDGKTVGDVDVNSVTKDKKDITLSPVPGGVGPVTIACLLDNAVTLAEKHVQ